MSRLDTLTKSLVELYSEKLSEQEQEVLIEALEVLAFDKKYNKFDNFFPDEGEFRRELYPKQIAFFDAGGKYNERALIAANQVGKCNTIRCNVELVDGTIKTIGELYESQEVFEVWAWDGEKKVRAKAGPVFKKDGLHECATVIMSDGRWFEAADRHRMLCEDGSWRFLNELLPDAFLNPTVHHKDAHRLLHKEQDSQSNCLEDSHPCDEQLPLGQVVSQWKPQRQVGVQEHISVSLREDGLENKYTYIDLPSSSLPSTLGDDSLASGLATSTQNQDAWLSVELSFDQDHIFQPCQTASYRTYNQFQKLHNRSSTLLACSSPLFVDDNYIVASNSIGCQEVYDFEVDTYHNYCLAGIVHHNSESGAYEATCHATGVYPEWWTGKRFSRPTLGWVGGDTATTCRDIIQVKLIGDDLTDMGSGMIPKELIIEEECKTRRNVPNALEIIKVKHVTGGTSTIVIKTYEQGRKTWQGTVVDWIWVDEECPQEVYGEALIRLMNSGGLIFTTFTPLSGVTELVLSFLDNSQDSDAPSPRYVGICTWDDVPHISEATKQQMLASTPPQLRDARSKGIPTVGEGLVYPIDPKNYVIEDFEIPMHYKKLYGMDVGWNNTAGLWGAWDQDNDVVYIYSEHKMGQAEPVVHAKAFKARGAWINGEIDPAARGRSQIDGETLFVLYRKEGLKIHPANNAVEAGIFNIWERFTSGRLKVFKSCTGFLREISLYHRDEKGKIAKTNDHLLDCLRYLLNAPPSVWSYPSSPKNKVIKIQNYMNACT